MHLLVISRYGWHGDELYFVECGRHLAFGYVDHAPLVPWIARATEIMGGGLVALRLPAVLAGAATLAFVALLVREWGGGLVAQALALAACTFAPAYLRMTAMLNIPVIEVALCAATSYVVARALVRDERRSWLVAGVLVGAGVLAKHSMLLWTLALAAGLALSPHRRVLATRWPWLGLALALAIALPNLIWQSTHDFATLEFLRNLRREVLAEQGRLLFVLGQLLYFQPLSAPIWIAGLRSREPSTRPFVIQFALMFTLLLISGGKPYYLGGAYPAMFAAGAIVLERWFASRRTARRAFGAAFAISGVLLGALSLPLLPLHTVDRVLERLLGGIVPPIALTHDMHGMYGWDEHVKTVARVHERLTPQERERTLVLTATYAQASAINVLGDERLPPAVTGHMTHYLWGPPPGRGDVLIAYGVPLEFLERHYADVTEVDRIIAPLARPFDADQRVFSCRSPRTPIASFWPELKRYRHRGPVVSG